MSKRRRSKRQTSLRQLMTEKEIVRAQARSAGLAWGVIDHHHNWELLTLWLDAFMSNRSVIPPNGLSLFKVFVGKGADEFPLVLSDRKTIRWCKNERILEPEHQAILLQVYGVPYNLCNMRRTRDHGLVCPLLSDRTVLNGTPMCRSQITRLVRSMDELGWDPSREVIIQ